MATTKCFESETQEHSSLFPPPWFSPAQTPSGGWQPNASVGSLTKHVLHSSAEDHVDSGIYSEWVTRVQYDHTCAWTNSNHVKSQTQPDAWNKQNSPKFKFSSRSLFTPIGQVRSGQVRCRSLNLASRKWNIFKLIIAYTVVLPFITNVNITYTCMHHGNSSYYITSLCKHSIGWKELLYPHLNWTMCRCVVCQPCVT